MGLRDQIEMIIFANAIHCRAETIFLCMPMKKVATQNSSTSNHLGQLINELRTFKGPELVLVVHICSLLTSFHECKIEGPKTNIKKINFCHKTA